MSKGNVGRASFQKKRESGRVREVTVSTKLNFLRGGETGEGKGILFVRT